MNPKDWPALPDEVTRDGPYRVYKGGRYAVYDDGNSAETPYQTDRANALESRLRDTAAALKPFVAMLQPHHDELPDTRPLFELNGAHFTVGDLRNARAILTQLRTEGLT